MHTEDQQQCERACIRLCHDFAGTVDACNYDAFVHLFSADGTFERGGQRYVGHQAIRGFLDTRPANRVTRHICSNIRIDMTGPTTATGSCSALMFLANAVKGTPLPLPVSPPVVVDYLDDYLLTSEGWKFNRRTALVVFQD